MKTVPLDFESISGRALIFEFKLDFKFTNQTCMILSRAIQTLPIVQGSEEMP